MMLLGYFLLLALSVRCEDDSREVKMFEDIESQDIIDNFDSFPLLRREVKPSGWCEGVDSLEEVREVGGELYSKLSLVDRTIIQPITNTKNNYTTQVVLRPVLNCFEGSDERLAAMVRELMVEPDPQAEYNLSLPLEELLEIQRLDPFDLSNEMNNEIFGGKVTEGFFIEAGAYGGDEDSHSLLFESKYNWTGLLVEPFEVDILQSRNRKSTIVPFCLGIEDKPQYVEFDVISAFEIDPERNKIAMRGIVPGPTETSSTLQCLPVYTLLLAAGNPTVHWFILDIEGVEFQVLQTIPWHSVDIEIISVETDLAGLVMPGSRQEIIEYMKSQGYIHRSHQVESHIKSGVVKDDLFIREDVFQRYKNINTNSHILRDEL